MSERKSGSLKGLGAIFQDELISNVILDSMEEAIYVRGLGRELLYINRAAERLTGWSLDEAIKRPCYEIFGDAEAKCNLECPIDRAIRLKEISFHSEGSVVDRDGNEKQVQVSISPIFRDDEAIATVVALRDITQLRDLEQTNLKTLMELEQAHLKLKRSEARFREYAELSSDWWWETDAEHRFIHMGGPNAAARQHLMGRRRDELVDTSLAPEAWELFQQCLDNRALFRDFVYPQEMKNGSRRWVKISGNPIFDDDGTFIGYRGVGSDITASVKENENLRASAEKDVLTGLYNRRGFERVLNDYKHERRGGEDNHALAVVDLDRFKPINDTYGHMAGDKVLVAQANRLVDIVREEDIVARLGGDEFAVLLRGLSDEEAAKRIASKICTKLRQPILIDESISVESGASVGIALFAAQSTEIDTIIAAADRAMYDAKRSGRNRYAVTGTDAVDEFVFAE